MHKSRSKSTTMIIYKLAIVGIGTVGDRSEAWKRMATACGSTSRCMLGLLRRAGSGHVSCVLLVTCIVHAVRAHAKRCRDAPRICVSADGLGTDLSDLSSLLEI